MTKLPLALVSVGVLGAAFGADRTVLIPMDDKPFTAAKSVIVRLTGKGIAGSKIEAKVEGPAKIVDTSTLRPLANGRPTIGTHVKEFDVQPTEAGKVTVTITVTPPQPTAEPKVTKYQFDVR